ncbi:MAG: iron-containing alcohol dehydrogenase [Deltaproteobacteria bacterium]|nr:iron-containing alcohol dehydrogenase [Deltaproteobacteria bacterium]
MADAVSRAQAILRQFKGDAYAFGFDVLDQIGPFAAMLADRPGSGKKAMFVGPVQFDWFTEYKDRVLGYLTKAGLEVVDVVNGAGPNAPFVDVYRIHAHIMHKRPDVMVVMDSGSSIDAVKAAAVLATLGDIKPELDPYFGVGKVTEVCQLTGRKIMPVLAVMTAASSGAHLTKYSNITDPVKGQKKLIVDEAIIPPKAVFDYSVTVSQPASLTQDGALDGCAHCLEIYYGAKGDIESKTREVAEVGIDLLVSGLSELNRDSESLNARLKLGLGTDLGGYAIMIGGTSGAHLNSFTLVDVLSHGRACALMNPYYTVFFAPAIQEKLRVIGEVYKKHGYIQADLDKLCGRDLGVAVAEGMVQLSKAIGFPTKLTDVSGITRAHITRCLNAAKDPQLEMKLLNMPVPMTAAQVDDYMGPILQAAWEGRFELIKNLG